MRFLEEIYRNRVEENERILNFWEDYLNKLKSLDFNLYADKLTVPILVPVGKRIFFRGDLKHTNEVTVSLGADYFAKCSLKQANVLRQHRIKDAQSKVDLYKKEKEYLVNQFSFTKENVYENEGQEIVEVYTEEEDISWREKHRENMREYKQKQKNHENSAEITDEQLWERLEELELQEELESELIEANSKSHSHTESKEESFVVREEDVITKNIENKSKYTYTKKIKDILQKDKEISKFEENNQNKEINNKTTSEDFKVPKETSKLDLLQQVIDRQNELQSKLTELKNKERSRSKTEEDLMSKLDEMEQLDELEDEIDRLDDILQTEDIAEKDEYLNVTKLQRRVSFADENDSETLELTFTHSNTEPNYEPYDTAKGIQKPSDIYKIYSNIFNEETTSILKKTKYEVDKVAKKEVKFAETEEISNKEKEEELERKTIVIKDVIEKVKSEKDKLENEGRPMSLFKKQRLQNKSYDDVNLIK